MNSSGLLATNQIYRFYTFETYLREVAACGIKAIDLWAAAQHLNVNHMAIYNLEEVKTLLEKYEIAVKSLTPEQSNPKPYNISSTQESVRKNAVDYIENLMKVSNALHCGLISLNSGWCFWDEPKEAGWEAMIKSLKELCSLASRYGLKLSIEALSKKSSLLVNSKEDLKRVIEEVGREELGITIDTGTVTRNGDSIEDYFKMFQKRITYCHLTNYSSKVFGHLAWWDERGELDSNEIISIFEKYCYEGYFALEMTLSEYYLEPQNVYKRSLERLLKKY